MNARLAAARTLLAIERGRTTLARELERHRADATQPGPNDGRDRGLLVELAAGVLRWRNELDAVLAAATGRDVSLFDADTRVTLRLGAYQLRHLDRIPPHAIVNESVELVRELGATRAAGFVNGVLRGLTRNPQARALPRRPGATRSRAEAIRYLSVSLSHPAWLVTRWLDRYGFEATERWCQFNNTVPEMTARSAGRLSREELLTQITARGLSATPAEFAPGAIRLGAGTLGRLDASLARELVVQDEGSQLVARVVGVLPGARVLDLCAAPGSKTLLIGDELSRSGTSSLLVASDLRVGRIAVLRSRLAAAGRPVPVVVLDATAPLPFGPVFDRILVDVPCSGLGTLRRDPDIKWTRQETDIAVLAAEAEAILSRASDAVRPGGRLVYATCSSEPAENDDVVDAFLQTHPSFRREPIAADAGRPTAPGVAAQVLDDRGQLVTDPVRHGLDAFFASVLVRTAAT